MDGRAKLSPMEQNLQTEQRYIEDPWAYLARQPVMPSCRWTQSVLLLLGAGLLLQPLFFDYRDPALMYSDIFSGTACFAIAAYTLKASGRSWASYLNGLVGLWLMSVPLLLWSPSPAQYLLGTLIGAFILTFSAVIPLSMEMPGPETPPGWTYNPSSWTQRAPIIALGLIGYLLARPLAGYQLGHSTRMLESEAWPVSKLGLGAMIYLIEILSAYIGDTRRWRTMPWMVMLFGFTILPLGVTSILLTLRQLLALGEWCTFCVLSIAAMFLMIPLSLGEITATIQFLNYQRKKSAFWKTLWRGGSVS